MKKEFTILKDNSIVEINLTHDSVCAGDDCDAPHEEKVNQSSFIDPIAFINHLSSGYLPSIAGVGHNWDCVLNDIVVGVVSVTGITPKVPDIKYAKENYVHFKYHSATY